MDIVELERNFTQYMAEKLTLEIDNTIFRGGVPDGVESGIGVLFNDEIERNSPVAPRTYNAQILGKFDTRDEAIRLNSRLSGLFPVYSSGDYKLITPRGDSAVYSATESGKLKWFVSFNLVLVILTSGVQV